MKIFQKLPFGNNLNISGKLSSTTQSNHLHSFFWSFKVPEISSTLTCTIPVGHMCLQVCISLKHNSETMDTHLSYKQLPPEDAWRYFQRNYYLFIFPYLQTHATRV